MLKLSKKILVRSYSFADIMTRGTNMLHLKYMQ